jgi:hypothetical protein
LGSGRYFRRGERRGHADADAHCHGDGNSNSHGNSNSDCHSNSNSNSYRYCHYNTIAHSHAAPDTYAEARVTEASSHASAAAIDFADSRV